jgi:N-acetylneuraminic acid mutarotase
MLPAPGFALAQKWSRAAPFPEAAEQLYGIAAGGKFCVFGGLAAAWTPKGLVYEYDPATDQRTKKKNMPQASHHIGLAELNGKIYAIGGSSSLPKGRPLEGARAAAQEARCAGGRRAWRQDLRHRRRTACQ